MWKFSQFQYITLHMSVFDMTFQFASLNKAFVTVYDYKALTFINGINTFILLYCENCLSQNSYLKDFYFQDVNSKCLIFHPLGQVLVTNYTFECFLSFMYHSHFLGIIMFIRNYNWKALLYINRITCNLKLLFWGQS